MEGPERPSTHNGDPDHAMPNLDEGTGGGQHDLSDEDEELGTKASWHGPTPRSTIRGVVAGSALGSKTRRSNHVHRH